MDLPQSPPPALITSVQHAEPPGALGMRTWRIHARKERDALEEVLRWVTQPSGRIVLLAESSPTFHDLLALTVRPGLAAESVPAEVSGA